MGVNDNVEDFHFNANVDDTTRQGNTYEGTDPPILFREGPEDQAEELLADDANSSAESATYDPAEYTVPEVKAWVAEHPDQVQTVLEAEEAGKNRTTLTDWLVAQE